MNFFAEDIRPEWEDSKNKGGYSLNLQYEIRDQSEFTLFFKSFQDNWLKLIFMTIGGSLIGNEYVYK